MARTKRAERYQADHLGETSTDRVARWQKNNPEKVYAQRRRYYLKKGKARTQERRAANPEAWAAQERAWRVKRKYGLTLEEVEGLLQEQGGRCAICRRPLDRPIIDHDHKTNRPRGILCWNCNIALGHFEDDLLRLEAAIAYLEVYSEMHKEVFG